MFRIASSVASLAFPLVVGGVVFVSAGRWDLPYVWAVLGILAAFCIAADRGQHAVAAGPYRWVRHPGYAAILFGLLSGGLAIGSWLAMLPALGFAALFIRRTLIEDRLLERGLPGYAEYARSVRFRLIPGVF